MIITLKVLFFIRRALYCLVLLWFHITFGTALIFLLLLLFLLFAFLFFFQLLWKITLKFWKKLHQFCRLLLADSCFHNINKKFHNKNKAVSNIIWKHRGPMISVSLELFAIFLFSCISFKFFSVLKLSFCKTFISSVTFIKIIICKWWCWLHLYICKDGSIG